MAVFEFEDGDVVIAGERSDVRRTVFENRQELGKEYGNKACRNISMSGQDTERRLVPDGGFPAYDGSHQVEVSEKEEVKQDYLGWLNTP